MSKFKLVQESISYANFLNDSDFYLDQDEYQFCIESGILNLLLTDHRLLTESEVKDSDTYRELETNGQKWLKYGIGTLLTLPSSMYHSYEHGSMRYALAGLLKTKISIKTGGITVVPLGILYMWWQRKNTDACNNRCSSNRNTCYYKCYVTVTNRLLYLAKRDLEEAEKYNNEPLVKKIKKQIKFYTKKIKLFEKKLAKSKV